LPSGFSDSLAARARVAVVFACLIGVPLAALVGANASDAGRDARRAIRHSAARRPVTATQRVSGFTQVRLAESELRQAEGPSAAIVAPKLRDQRPPEIAEALDEPPGDPLHAMLKRLEALGAKHYRLERTAALVPSYWFHCKMAETGEAFEAVGRSPSEAVRRVVEAVENASLRQRSLHEAARRPAAPASAT
jgi:hypothetical protein